MEMGGRIRDMMMDLRGRAKSAKDRVRDRSESMKDRGYERMENWRGSIEERPMTSLMIAFAAGLLFGLIITRNRD
jgi:ElaB/YqjD/DUF883 family membrane-anchored ribosome-binding protein